MEAYLSGDPVHRALGPSVDALVAHADELAALRDRLRTMVTRADLAGLTARRDELAAKEASGVAEAAGARGLLSLLTLFGNSDTAIADFVRSMIIHETFLLPIAIYWSRGFTGRYLASLRGS
jgi:hypothetical protein